MFVKPENLKYSGRFYIPEKLYGRSEEISTLIGEYRAISSKRKKKSINFVVGMSGIGKTEVVLEVFFFSVAPRDHLCFDIVVYFVIFGPVGFFFLA